MEPDRFESLVRQLVAMPGETEWLEFKHGNADPEEIGKNISGIANAAALLHEPRAYILWGVENGSHRILGTAFRPGETRKGGEGLQLWLSRMLEPRLDLRWHEGVVDGLHLVLLEVPTATGKPTAFYGQEFIRVGPYRQNLRDYPEKERALWALFERQSFEEGIALDNLEAGEVLGFLEFPAFFDKLKQPLPENRDAILARLVDERMLVRDTAGQYSITNLGAVLFAKDLGRFPSVRRKTLRVVLYRSTNRIETVRELPVVHGYALGYEEALSFLDAQLPRSELIGQALRKEVSVYPPLALRELVANALIHQDFSIAGSGPMVEVFSDRIEFTNPGRPLVDTQRFLDAPPRSRNEQLAAFMRRINICEERGSGVDKVVFETELFQLPAPDFRVVEDNTRAVLFAPQKLTAMDPPDRVRACYLHVCLMYVSNQKATNTTVRKRFGIEAQNYPVASRIISDTIKAGLIRKADPESKSKKDASYLPRWA